MSITVSQQLNHINENNYDDDITVHNVPKGYFPASTGNILPEGSATREITVSLFPLEQSEGGNLTTNPGLYVKGPDETAVKVTVKDENGKDLAENTTSY